MPVVVDANFLVALITPHPLREEAYRLLQAWVDEGTDLHAPALARYEVASALTRSIAARVFPLERLEDSCAELADLPIIYHPLMDEEPRVVEIALSLRRNSAYDAAYLALAETLGAELWTLDGPLYRNAAGLGFAVRLLGERS